MADKSSRLTYRSLSKDKLTVLLEHPTDDKKKADEFNFERAK